MSSNRLSFQDFPYICRLCLMKKNNLKLMVQLISLDVLKNITNIKMEDDDLPKNVCNDCTNKLEYISSFIDLCLKSETNLRNILVKYREIHSEKKDADQSFSPFEESNINLNENYDTNEFILPPPKNIKLEKPKETLCISSHDNVENKIIKASTKKQPSDCQICREHFSTRTKLYEHKKKNPACRTRHFKCTVCVKAFFTEFKLKLHMRSHTKETPFECKICLKKFRFASNVNRHIDSIHKGLKPFRCDICGKGFTRNGNLLEHKRNHSGELPYICNYCGLSFNKTRPYQYHLNIHKATNSKNSSDLKCDTCAKIFGSHSSLRKHKLTHTKENNFLCDICGRNFRTNQTLVNHINVHLDVKSFKCRFCDKVFSRKSTLQVHCLSHTKEKPFKCNICLKTFAQIVHLKNHERIHNGEKPYQCAFCSRKFSVKCNLVIHTRIHTKDTKYKCTVCGKMYYESRSLKRHMKLHQDSSLIVLTNEDISTLLL
ncbi:zinc finger protein OZF-like isoform X2 [Anoplophora glabripennis]|uniref:zinc finger protein OZF-like isoform X2 n=1 Tax=Anoplophora glabripennis TaxID=217634 RepID=UPI000874D538|nr:zinc finger protein OZF-like isoform X2 [Anoplophora glabripennis]